MWEIIAIIFVVILVVSGSLYFALKKPVTTTTVNPRPSPVTPTTPPTGVHYRDKVTGFVYICDASHGDDGQCIRQGPIDLEFKADNSIATLTYDTINIRTTIMDYEIVITKTDVGSPASTTVAPGVIPKQYWPAQPQVIPVPIVSGDTHGSGILLMSQSGEVGFAFMISSSGAISFSTSDLALTGNTVSWNLT